MKVTILTGYGGRTLTCEAKRYVQLLEQKDNYTQFAIPKKHGGVRHIDAPCEELKQFQVEVKDFLCTQKGMISTCAKGFVPRSSVCDNANLHMGKKYLLNIDLKDFFPSITTEMVLDKFGKLFSTADGSTDMSELVSLLTYKGHLPQGAPSSPVISNIICKKLDFRMQCYCWKCGATYTRYADDITISWNDDGKVFLFYDKKARKPAQKIVYIIESEGFKINDKKTFFSGVNGHKEVTGVIVNRKLNVPKDFYYRLRSMLNDCIKHGTEEAYRHHCEKKGVPFHKEGVKGFINMMKGMLAYFGMVVRSESDPARYNKLCDKMNIVLGKRRYAGKHSMPNLLQKAAGGDVKYQVELAEYYKKRQRYDVPAFVMWYAVAAMNGDQEARRKMAKFSFNHAKPFIAHYLGEPFVAESPSAPLAALSSN